MNSERMLNRTKLPGVSRMLTKAWIITLLFAALATGQTAPEQPIPYSHKLHAGTLQLKCNRCHVNADPGDAMGFPPVATCMTCHTSIATNKPSIQKLAAASKNGEQIAWERVYHTPPWVWFSHRSHLAADVKCESCHGPVAEREKMVREGDISMKACMACHQSKNVSTDCSFCHERP
jgi:hypothetical protein